MDQYDIDDDSIGRNSESSDSETSLKEEVETLKKEVFLSLYNLFQVAKKHEEVLQTIEGNLKIISESIMRHAPSPSIEAAGQQLQKQAASQPAVKRPEKSTKKQSDSWKIFAVAAASFAGVMLVGAGVYFFVLR